MKEWNDKDIGIDMCLVGSKAVGFFILIGKAFSYISIGSVGILPLFFKRFPLG